MRPRGYKIQLSICLRWIFFICGIGVWVASCPASQVDRNRRSQRDVFDVADFQDSEKPTTAGELDEASGVDVDDHARWDEVELGTLVEFDEGPLARFFEALQQTENGGNRLVRVLHYGDSHTAADVLTSAIRRALQKRFGDGGRGFVLMGRPWRSYYPQDVSISARGAWQTQRILLALDPTELDGRYGLAGVAVEGKHRGVASGVGTATNSEFGRRVARFELFYLRQPRGGSFLAFIDGKRVGRVRSAADHIDSGFFERTAGDGAHEFEIRLLGDGPVRLFGTVLEREGPGVVYDTLGINGAFFFTPQRWDAALLSAQVERRNPDLIVAMYGTNDADARSLTPERYEATIKDTMRRLLKGARRADCLLIGPPDRQAPNLPDGPERLDWLIDVQRETADEIGCAFIDAREMMGGADSRRLWMARGLAQPDGIHLTLQGYQLLGELLARQLLEAYERYGAMVRQPLDTAGEWSEDTAVENDVGGAE